MAATADFTLTFGDFASTEAELVADSDNGKTLLGEMFGFGAVSVKLPKSKANDLERFLSQKGFAVNIWVPGCEEAPGCQKDSGHHGPCMGGGVDL